ARDPPGSVSPVPVPVHAPGLSLPTGGTRPLGVVARVGLSVSLCVPVPRVVRVPRRAPWSRWPRVCSDPAMFLSPPVLILGWLCTHVPSVSCPHGSCAPPLAVLMSLRCPCPRGRALSPGIPPCPHTVPPCPQAGLALCQREAEEVVELMRQNVARALEREGYLEQLQSRAQDLRQASEAFTRITQTMTQRQRRRHRRWHLVALGLGLLLLFILGLALVLALARSSPGTVTSTVPTPQGGTKHPPRTAGTP
ncbi:VAMP5 protein, partial [Sterrhoptilus dennistouni]|nr:VAMP5 protein [Sterrhoptilus dennistouni]